MKRITFLFFLSVLLTIPSMTGQRIANSAAHLESSKTGGRIGQVIFPSPTTRVACDGVLANYTNSTSNGAGTTSQSFLDLPTYSNAAADDFVVPGSNDAIICQVAISGFAFNPVAADQVRLDIYANAGGAPGALVFTETFQYLSVDPTKTGSFVLSPTGVPNLTAGATYWLSAAVIADYSVSGQWFWTTGTDTNGSAPYWQNPGGGFGTGCATWGQLNTCLGDASTSLAMDISFNEVAGGGGSVGVCATDTPMAFDPPYNINSTITITETGIIGTGSGEYHFDDINFNAQDGWASDLDFFLKSPSGTILTLSSRKGGSNGLATASTLTFTDSSTNDINVWYGGAPLADYQAQGGLLNTVFAGEPVNGIWTLNVVDAVQISDGGMLNSFCINMSPAGGTVGNPPVIACPADITANNDAGVCTAVVNFANAIAFDIEDGVITTTQTGGPASGSAFPLGATTVEFSATDSDGNTVTCEFTVTVVDNENPVAVCQNVTVDLDPVTGTANITGADLDNGSSDNCGIASITLSKSAFSCADVGDNTVTVTVTDNAGNTATCTATVTVQDVTAPEVFCVGGFATFSQSEDFEGASIPTGWTTVIETGGYDWSFGSGTMPGGDSFPTNAAIFDDDAAGSGGGANKARLVSPAYDLAGATNVELSFDYSVQDFAGSGTFEAEVWDGTAWQRILFVDNTDQPPINSGIIDVSAYLNAAFQVRFTYDDEGDWAWGAGVDNFLLEYEKAGGGGLDVYLDANGIAVVDANDLVLGVTEACGYSITVAGGTGGGGSPGSITTLFASNNGGSPGWIQFFDITVGPNDIDITDLDVNTSDTAAINMDIYTKLGTSVGFELNAGAWGAPVATGTGTGAGTDLPSNVILATPLTLDANTTYGIGIKMDRSPRYTNGTGCPGNQCYSNADLSLALGSVVSGQFSGSVFTPRIFNGTINYTSGPAAVIEFTCANLGENLVEVTVTDASGNAATCMAVVNVIDNIAPIITCAGTPGPVAILEDFNGSSIPSGWTTQINSGSQDWAFGSGVMPTGGNFPTNAAIFDDDAAGSGTVNMATLISPVYNLSGSATASISFDYALQTYLDDGTLTVEVYDGAAWQQVLFVDAITNPTNTGNIDVAAYINTNFQVRFIYDDEGGWSWGVGVDNFTLNYEITSVTPIDIALGPDGTTTIDPYDLIQGVDEACGLSTVAIDVPIVTCADIGTLITVTVFASDTSGNIASCTAIINVIDTLAPVITCPADQTVDPGAGNLYYIVPDYFATGEATAIDNCTDPVTVTTQDPAPGAAIPDGVYTVTLTATDEYGNTSTCDFELTVDTIVGVADNSLDTGLMLYPNPAKHVVNLVNKTNISLEKMMIYDINGKLVNQVDLRTMQGERAVDISSLASGVYVVQIIGDNASTVKRLIKE